MMRANRVERRGDTLIEVVFALAILASILVAITTGSITAWRTSRLAGERTQASAMVNEQAEALKASSRGRTIAELQPVLDPAVTNGGCMVLQAASWVVNGSAGGCSTGARYTPTFMKVSGLPGGAIACQIVEDICTVKIQVSWQPIGSAVPETSSQVVTIGGDR